MERSGEQKMKDIWCGLCQTKSLLFGSWEFIGGENEEMLLERFGNVPGSKASTFLSAKKQVIHLKPTDNEDTWLFRAETDTMGATFIVISFGEEKHELTIFRTSAKVTYVREGKNKISANYMSYDNAGKPSNKMVREVKWWRPNRMITTITIDSKTCIRMYKRIIRPMSS